MSHTTVTPHAAGMNMKSPTDSHNGPSSLKSMPSSWTRKPPPATAEAAIANPIATSNRGPRSHTLRSPNARPPTVPTTEAKTSKNTVAGEKRPISKPSSEMRPSTPWDVRNSTRIAILPPTPPHASPAIPPATPPIPADVATTLRLEFEGGFGGGGRWSIPYKVTRMRDEIVTGRKGGLGASRLAPVRVSRPAERRDTGYPREPLPSVPP